MAEATLDASVLRKSLNELRLAGQSVSIDLPLLEQVYDLNREVAEKFPAKGDTGIGQMGLLLDRRLETSGYWCTPINSLSFGGTGGDGATPVRRHRQPNHG